MPVTELLTKRKKLDVIVVTKNNRLPGVVQTETLTGKDGLLRLGTPVSTETARTEPEVTLFGEAQKLGNLSLESVQTSQDQSPQRIDNASLLGTCSKCDTCNGCQGTGRKCETLIMNGCKTGSRCPSC